MTTIKTVNSKTDWSLFHQAQINVYRDDPNFIAPLRMEVEQVFDPSKNAALAHGRARCFVLLEEKRPVGRIAAFIDEARNAGQQYRTGGIGFFECIDQPAYAKMLFNTAEEYLREYNVAVVDGPINFGERDKFWGLLVHNFAPPLYQENYNPPRYEALFRESGYIPFEQILTFSGAPADIPIDRLRKIAQRLRERHPLRVEPFDFKQIDTFARDFAEVYNASFNQYDHFSPVTPEQVHNMMEAARPIIDPQVACIAYYDDQPAGFVALYPDINPLLKGLHGKLNLFTLPRFFFRKLTTHTYNIKGMGFGIHPEYQSKGIFALLIDHMFTDRILKRYPRMYLATVRAHNHEIRSIYEKLHVGIDRVHVAYRKALRPGTEIKPFEFIDLEELESR